MANSDAKQLQERVGRLKFVLIDAVVLPPEEMVQEEVIELRDVEDLCDHKAIIDEVSKRCLAKCKGKLLCF